MATGLYVIGADAVAAKFNAAAARVKAQQPLMLQQCAETVKVSITGNIVSQGLMKTGQLVQSGRVFGISGTTAYVGFGKGVVNPESGSPYAWALEIGAVPHVIYAKGTSGSGLGTRAGLLSFEWDKSPDGWFVGPFVMHPGVRPYRFVRQGAMEAAPQVMEIIYDKITSALMLTQ